MTVSDMFLDVVHFDIKADNILLEPLEGVSDLEFWKPTGDTAPFRVCLGDFGESILMENADGFTTRNRGTEPIKSPEMLNISWTGMICHTLVFTLPSSHFIFFAFLFC